MIGSVLLGIIRERYQLLKIAYGLFVPPRLRTKSRKILESLGSVPFLRIQLSEEPFFHLFECQSFALGSWWHGVAKFGVFVHDVKCGLGHLLQSESVNGCRIAVEGVG